MNSQPVILIIDDDQLVLASLGALLRKSGYETIEAVSGEAGLERLESDPAAVSLLLCDLSLPGIDGIEVLKRAKALRPDLPVIMFTAYGSIENAVAAMKAGAKDYVTKPVDDFVLVQKIRRAQSEDRVQRENEDLKAELGRSAPKAAIVHRHRSMEQIIAKIEAVAATRATVLVQGESGTGKTMIARSLHQLSDRRDGPFVEFSCGSLPDPLLESELFGYEKGAFTGADVAKEGKFEAADGGSIFLDEIANATPALQVKLLRVLQDRSFERLGSNKPRQADVRLILATNVDLEAQVRQGKFREDLFYRINVVSIQLPPLRERQDDIPLLADHFMRRFAQEYKKDLVAIAPDVQAWFASYAWPGNVRELENAVEHAAVLAQGDTLNLEDLPPRYLKTEPDGESRELKVRPLKKAMELPEREYILRALRLNKGNRQQTALMLNVNRTTLFNKMKKYGLFEEDSDA
ncbi:MAG: sigma-54 dependent transcriptional regulator [Planctomycetota bacterium]